MAEIVSLDQVRYEKTSRQAALGSVSFALDFSGVTRHQDPDGDKLTDPIRLSAATELQVRRLFWQFGLRRLPATWGELVGNWTYCKVLSLWAMPLRGTQPDYIRQSFFDIYEQEAPGRGTLVQAFVAEDLDTVWKLHQQWNTFEENGRSTYWTRTKIEPSQSEGS